jgi:DNA modification methylase
MIEWVSTTERFCNCKNPNRLNCLNGKQWVKSMIGVWEFTYEKKDVRDKSIHPAVFPIALPKKAIRLFTHRGEIVLDPFCGIGTTMIGATETSRHSIGIELNKSYCDYAMKRLQQKNIESFAKNIEIYNTIINADIRNIKNFIPENSIDLIVTSPPYANLLDKKRNNTSYRGRKNERLGINEQYSNDKRDFGTYNPDKFFKELSAIASLLKYVLKPDKHLIINMMDIRPQCFVQPRLKDSIESAGFYLKNIIIWDKRNLINNTGIFGYPSNYITLNNCYEYIFDFEVLKEG